MSERSVSFQLKGERIRELRRRLNLSSTALAERMGVTPAYISQIERDLAEPSLSVLRRLAGALNVDLPALLEYEAPADTRITSAGDAAWHTFAQANAKYRMLTPASLKNGARPELTVMLVGFEAGKTDYDEKVVQDFEEFCYVLEGCIEYRTDKRSYLLEEGDSIYIKKNVPHLLYNPGQREARLLGVLGSVHPHLREGAEPAE
ncbi:XRE family transcriptional regulator [Saccharibacillus sp. CPCC 101409]|uniref:helix-turn-helix domain-containing protein n=1 Tax=Saccharibacillus sp. CPCC 101409 TaxID=3058041 RepID=UPI002672E458|nr:XRE family transcriptional regulator [Saccharibacillus sp. CPCC 101409]MDO3408951.1 XRE family transcriptional regulator [Saccharibacillus sp. CPCC 101409]